MANIDRHPPGSFCWIELGTTDQNAAKQFYQPLLGWTSNDFPMGPGEFYTMFQLEGRDSGAAYTLNQQMREQGVPPHWMLYIAVASADDAVAKATQLGGSVKAGPFDVMDFGRMAVLADPTGAVFSIWEPKSHVGTRITGVPGTLCWADLSTPDTAAASAFYKGLFGWEITTGEGDYLHVKNGDQFIGGVPPAAHRQPGVPPHWLLYFLVADCDASAAKAKDAGAAIYMGPMTMEKVGRMAVLADPQHAVFAIFQPLPHS
jgi:predicted enzyme related to lactoylglutathione lyase